MGVCVDPARKVQASEDDIIAGYAPEAWQHDSCPDSPGYTYSHWQQILDDLLLLGETNVTSGTMPCSMLELHLTMMFEAVEERVRDQLYALLNYCEQNGYSHIGWA